MLLPGKKYKHISFILCMVIIFSTIAGALIGAPVVVYALSVGGIKGTIASIIISLLLQTGVAPTNTQFLNAINNAYGVESTIGTIENCISSGLLTESGGTLIDTGLSAAIQSESVWTEWSLNEIFATTAIESGVLPGSGAVNLANTAINLGTGGTIGAFAGAVAVGVGVGVLANHVREYVTNLVKFGFPMNMKTKQDLISNVPSGFDRAYYINSIRPNGNDVLVVVYAPFDVMCSAYKTNSGGRVGIVGSLYTKDGVGAEQTYQKRWTNSTMDQDEIHSPGVAPSMSYVNTLVETNLNPIFDTQNDLNNYISNYANDENTGSGEIFSPDLIGNNGNLKYDYENDDVPNIGNIVPQNSDMENVPFEDYLNYVDQANDNTENGDIGEDTQGEEFNDFIANYFTDPEQEPIIPDNPVDPPEAPDRPVVPDQPTIPTKPEISDADIQDALQGATTIDLRSVFPFCIPWDIYNLILIFDTGEDRRAPHITFTFPFNDNWVIDVDLADYNEVAGILRLLELILFIIGLMVATRALIGAKG